MKAKHQRVFVDTDEAARILGFSPTHFRKYFAPKHNIHPVDVGAGSGRRKKYFYLVKELEDLKDITHGDGNLPTGRREIHRVRST